MRNFVIEGPGGVRLQPRPANSAKELQETLVEGYRVIAEVLPPGITVEPPLADVLPRHTLLTWLLREHGEELAEWIARHPRFTPKANGKKED